MALPKVTSYRKYSTSNQGTNSLKLEAGNLTLYYNYGRLAGFTLREEEVAVAGVANWRSYNRKNEEFMIVDMKASGFEDIARVNYSEVDKAMRQEFDTPLPSVTILTINSDYVVTAIKAVRAATGLGLAETKEIIDQVRGGTPIGVGQLNRNIAITLSHTLRREAAASCKTGDFLDDKVLTSVVK